MDPAALLFEQFSVDNVENLDMEFAAAKAKPKKATMKAPKPPPGPKPASAAALKETRKLLEKKVEVDREDIKYKKLRQNTNLRKYFGGKLAGKYKALSIANTEEEIDRQNREIKEELDSRNSVPHTKHAFTMFMGGAEAVTKMCGLQTHGLQELASEPQVFEEHFDEPLTRLAIEHSLFETGPLGSLISSLGLLIMTVHYSNANGQKLSKPADDLVNDPEFADL